jgi:hypothetical protein
MGTADCQRRASGEATSEGRGFAALRAAARRGRGGDSCWRAAARYHRGVRVRWRNAGVFLAIALALAGCDGDGAAIGRASAAALPAQEPAAILTGAAPAPATAAPGGLVALRAGARAILQERCLPCHSRSDAGAKPKALAVFDLDVVDWSRTLSDERLPKLVGRLQSKISAAELAQVQQFIDAELGARHTAPAAAGAW